MKFGLCLCVFASLITLMVWISCGDIARTFVPTPWKRRTDGKGEMIEDIDCIINQEDTVGCLKEGDEVFLPFSFLNKYFEVYGSLNTVDGSKRFDWSHSYGKVNYPKNVYDPKGIFMYFENYNVEMRDRVKCISASEGE